MEPIIPNFCIINYWLDLVGGIPTPLKKYESQMRVTNIVLNRTTGAPLRPGPPSNPPGFWPGAPCNGGRMDLDCLYLVVNPEAIRGGLFSPIELD